MLTFVFLKIFNHLAQSDFFKCIIFLIRELLIFSVARDTRIRVMRTYMGKNEAPNLLIHYIKLSFLKIIKFSLFLFYDMVLLKLVCDNKYK